MIKTSPFSEWGRKLALFKEKTFLPSWVAQMNKIEISKDQIGMNVMCWCLKGVHTNVIGWIKVLFKLKLDSFFGSWSNFDLKMGRQVIKVSLHQHVSVLNCVLESRLVMVADTRSHEFIHILQLCIGSGVYWNFNVASFYLKISISLNKTWLLWSRQKVGREVIP